MLITYLYTARLSASNCAWSIPFAFGADILFSCIFVLSKMNNILMTKLLEFWFSQVGFDAFYLQKKDEKAFIRKEKFIWILRFPIIYNKFRTIVEDNNFLLLSVTHIYTSANKMCTQHWDYIIKEFIHGNLSNIYRGDN